MPSGRSESPGVAAMTIELDATTILTEGDPAPPRSDTNKHGATAKMNTGGYSKSLCSPIKRRVATPESKQNVTRWFLLNRACHSFL